MNIVAAAQSIRSKSSLAWNVTLILIPVATAAILLWLRHTQVQHLAARQITDYGTVPPFQFVNQNGQPFGSADLRGKIWIDQKNYGWVKVEAEAIDTISWGFFVLRIHKGSRIAFEQTRVNDEIWLPKRVAVNAGE